MFEKKYVYELEELPSLVSDVILIAKECQKDHAVVLALSGDLGAGKTTFVQELARQIGVIETVTSPTFTLMRQYDTTHVDFQSLIHMDAYRIEVLDELGPLRFTELLTEPKTLMCIEWPERISSALPLDHILITIEIDEMNRRTAQVTGG